MSVKGFSCFMLILVMMALCDASRFSRYLTVKKHSNQFKRSPLKSIQSNDGDIIDCVHISHQPAFDHPLLKDHTIQMRPNYHPEGLLSDRQSSNIKHNGKDDVYKKNTITQLWQLKGRCPEGSIPIKRTKEEDITRASPRLGKKKKKTTPHERRLYDRERNTTDPYESAGAFVRGDVYYGAKAILNLWGPQVQLPTEYSTSQFWISGGPFYSDLNSISAGWHVFPELYGDNYTRLFSSWTIDNYNNTGCYNLLCSGFVQVNKEIALGATIAPLSSYLGTQFAIPVLVWKDPIQAAWWLQFGNDTMGYWPASLFTHLAQNASLIEWGGQVFNSQPDGRHTTTQMGSGHFPEEGFGGASYIRDLLVVNGSNYLIAPTNLSTFATRPYCYNVTLGKTDDWEDFIFYGGPGRNPNCP